MRAPLPLVAALVGLVAASCGGGRGRGGAAPSASEVAYPSLALVPSSATWLVATTRASEAIELVRALLEPTAPAFDRGERDVIDLVLTRGPAELGLDGLGGAALFGGLREEATLVASISDPALLGAKLDELRPTRDVSVTRHGDVELFYWKPDERAVAWAIHGDWLIVHVGAADPKGAWLDPILAAARGVGLGDGPEVAAAIERARAGGARRPDGRVPTILALGRRVATGLLGGALPAEADCLVSMATALTDLSAAADLDADRGVLELSIGLRPSTARALATAIGPAAAPGLVAYRATAAAHASLAFDLDWLARRRGGTGCDDYVLPIGDPLRAFSGGPGARAYHAALEALDPEDLEGRGVLEIALRDAGFFQRQLDAIPGRSIFERRRRIGGVEVRVLGGLPGLPSVAYELTDDRLIAASPPDLAKHVVAAAPPARAPARAELASFGLSPGRLKNLGRLLAAVLRALEPSRDGADEFGEQVALELRRRFAALALDVALEGDRLVVTAAARLRR
jgi:hypothetical protein